MVLRKEFPDSPFHWLDQNYVICCFESRSFTKKLNIFFFFSFFLFLFFSWMGRTIVERPLREIASFLECPESAKIYDKYIKVCILR